VGQDDGAEPRLGATAGMQVLRACVGGTPGGLRPGVPVVTYRAVPVGAVGR
jgi:hypothetical protein